MNIILFSEIEVELPLARRDPRARHILAVLRRGVGGEFDAGIIDGPRGKGTVAAIGEDALSLSFKWATPPPELHPMRLIVGLPRPQTARDLLREGASLGLARMDFVRPARGEAGYAASSLWSTDEWKQLLVAGAAQAFCTRLPAVHHGDTLAGAIAQLPAGGARIALDNYEASVALADATLPAANPVVLALGSERGWTDAERTLLRASGFLVAHLGPRVLRTETACIAAVTLLKAKRGWA